MTYFVYIPECDCPCCEKERDRRWEERNKYRMETTKHGLCMYKESGGEKGVEKFKEWFTERYGFRPYISFQPFFERVWDEWDKEKTCLG